jgi:hypothetical protein
VNPRLPDLFVVPPPYVPPTQSLSRPTATAINRASETSPEYVLTVSGFNQIIPVIYGEDRVSGQYLVKPRIYSGDFLCAIAWSWGEIEGVQSLYINGAVAPGGVTLTHYTGTEAQTADATLSAAIAGFNDAYTGIAYTVIRIPTGTVTGFPQTARIEAVVRGRKVLDPRTSTTAWSRNPALCMRDFITSTRYGPGLEFYGTDEVADRCDSLVGGVEVRSQMGLTIGTPLNLDAICDLFSAYAECLWTYDDEGVLVVPDAPVDEMQFALTTDDIVGDTLRLVGEPLNSAPTMIAVTYRESSGGAAQWPEEVEIQELPGVSTGDVPEIRSDLYMPGIRRDTEAARKGLSRIRRLAYPGRYAWQAFDDGIKFQRGDVGTLPDTRGMVGRQVRIMSIEMVSAGIYQITAEQYDPAIYPEDFVPGSTTTIPVGGIVPTLDSTAPAGWDFFTAADGRFLFGAGGDRARGATWGATTFTVSGSTNTRSNHGAGTPTFPTQATPAGTGVFLYSSVTDSAGSHSHSFSVAQDRTPLYVQTKLIVKTGTPDELPANAGFWADGEIISAAFSALNTNLGRMIRSGTSGTGGASLTYTLSLGLSSDGAHDHFTTIIQCGDAVDFSNQVFDPVAVGNHTHATSIPVAISLPRKKLAHYVASGTAPIEVGGIIGFNGDGSLPPGWYNCDGTNGTPDLTDFWVERSAPADAGAAISGDKTASWSGTTGSGGQHNHKGAEQIITRTTRIAYHDDAEAHTHTVSGSVAYEPPSYAMRFIQYTGVI